MTIELTYPTSTFDNAAHFAFEYLNWRKQPTRGQGYLFRDDRTGEVYLMQASSMIKDHYTAEDRAHTDRIYRGEQVVRHGDTVLIDGKAHTVKVLGDYSDAGRMIPVA